MSSLDVEDVFHLARLLESFVSLITLALSIYFLYKIANVSTINGNLKVIVISTTAFCLYLSIAHSVLNFIPQECYSIQERGLKAFMLHGVVVSVHLLTIMLEFKYLLIAIERVYAYRMKGRYEHQGLTVSYRLLGLSLLASLFILLIRIRIGWITYEDLPLDGRLIKALHPHSILWGHFICFFLVSSFTTSLAGTLFYYLHVMIKRDEMLCHPLHVRYEIEQTKYVLKYILSLMSLAIVLLLCCLCYYTAIFYFVRYKKVDEDGYEVKSIVALIMTSLSLYNFTSMMYMAREFPQLQQAIRKDLPFLEKHIPELGPVRVSPADETDVYFKQLSHRWS